MIKFKQDFDKIVIVGAFIIFLISTVSMILSDKSFVLDLFSHYQLQYLIILSIFAITLFVFRNFVSGILIILYCIFLFSAFIHPVFFFEEEMETEVFYMNTYYKNYEHELIKNEILKLSPEIVFLVESNKNLVNLLEEDFNTPLIHIDDKYNSFALFSHIPAEDIKVHRKKKPHFISAKFENFTLIGVHAFSPLTPSERRENLKYLNDIVEFIETIDGKFLLVGDFNNTIYSRTFRKPFKKYFHKNIYTWSTNRPWLLPIDHALSNFEIKISPSKSLNSDHRGLKISTK